MQQAQAQMLAAAAARSSSGQQQQIPSSAAAADSVRVTQADLIALAQSQALGGTPAAAAASQVYYYATFKIHLYLFSDQKSWQRFSLDEQNIYGCVIFEPIFLILTMKAHILF